MYSWGPPPPLLLSALPPASCSAQTAVPRDVEVGHREQRGFTEWTELCGSALSALLPQHCGLCAVFSRGTGQCASHRRELCWSSCYSGSSLSCCPPSAENEEPLLVDALLPPRCPSSAGLVNVFLPLLHESSVDSCVFPSPSLVWPSRNLPAFLPWGGRISTQREKAFLSGTDEKAGYMWYNRFPGFL